jgi:hypothetical protein
MNLSWDKINASENMTYGSDFTVNQLSGGIGTGHPHKTHKPHLHKKKVQK